MLDVIQVQAATFVPDLWEQIGEDEPRPGGGRPRPPAPPRSTVEEPIVDPRHSTMIQEIIEATEARRAANPGEDEWLSRWPM